jgi:hypothetical protein
MSWMKHFADFSADLYFFKLSVLIQKFNKKSSGGDFSADIFADLIPAHKWVNSPLKEYKVIFVIIGATAFSVHGY